MSVLGSTSRNVLRRARANVRSCAASSATWHAKCIGYSWLLEPLLLLSRGLDTHRSISGCSSERDEWLRAAWKAMIANKLDARRLVFVDEMGTNTALSPLYAWAPRGHRARWSVPRNRAKNTTLLASMSVEGMG